MIPNHAQFLAACQKKQKVCVRFYSRSDSGILNLVCAPMDYGPGRDNKEGVNRYWLWNYASDPGSHVLGLVPQQILDLQLLGEVFDPSDFATGPTPGSAFQADRSIPADLVSPSVEKGPEL